MEISTHVNLTPISLGLISLAVDCMTPPKRPPPLPRFPPIISADLRIIQRKNPIINRVGNKPPKLLASISDL